MIGAATIRSAVALAGEGHGGRDPGPDAMMGPVDEARHAVAADAKHVTAALAALDPAHDNEEN